MKSRTFVQPMSTDSKSRSFAWRRIALVGLCLGGLSFMPCFAGERIELDGEWNHWIDAQTNVPVNVPFSVEPMNTTSVYQRSFTVPADMCEDVVLLRFDGVGGQATIFLNGVELGQHGSFTPFFFDVAALINIGGENDLVVTINDLHDATTIPFDGIAWVDFSGIIRSVYLECADQAILLSSQPQYQISEDYSVVNGEVFVEAHAAPGATVSFFGAIVDGEVGTWDVLASMDWVVATADATGLASSTLAFSMPDPELWSPDSPRLYGLYVVANVDGLTADERFVSTGFRNISVSGNDVLLNGQPLLLKGVSRHDIYPDTGYVGTDAQILEDLQRIKNTGANYLRTIHYPQDPRVLDIADQIGLLVSEEVPAWANFFDPQIRQRLYTLLEEMIRRDMHHPSIFLWITGNATVRPMPYALEAQQIAKGLDQNRLASYIIDINEAEAEDIALDVAFFEDAQLDLFMKIGWWFQYLAELQENWARMPKDIPVIMVEFGQEGNDREPLVVGGPNPCWWSEASQASDVNVMLEAWRPHLPQYNAQEHLAGMVYFNFTDLDWPGIVEQQPDHIPSIHTGLVYEDRIPKLVIQTLTNFYSTLPTSFVGVPEIGDDGVEPVFDTATNLGPVVNDLYRDTGLSINADGDTIYYASNGSSNDDAAQRKLFFSTKESGAWTAPVLVDMLQETEAVAFRRSPCISYDGQTLYYTRGEVDVVCFTWPVINVRVVQSRIWKTEFVQGNWSDPVDLGDVVNGVDDERSASDPSISADGNTLFFSSDRDGGNGQLDLWMSTRVGGVWTSPVNLGPDINSGFDDHEPAVSPDGTTLYFASNRPGGYGNGDIWVSRWVDGQWASPRNLGPGINTSGGENEPEISKDGRHLYFTGVRTGGVGIDDLWFATSVFAPADFDQDGDADLLDFWHMQQCFSGDGVPQNDPICMNARLDMDTDVDLDDYELFQSCVLGPIMPVDAGCLVTE